jgi:hypothetical protein
LSLPVPGAIPKGWCGSKPKFGGPVFGSPVTRSIRVLARTVSVETPRRWHHSGAPTAIRVKRTTMTKQIIAMGSRRSRPNAIWVGDLPAITAADLLGSSGGSSWASVVSCSTRSPRLNDTATSSQEVPERLARADNAADCNPVDSRSRYNPR